MAENKNSMKILKLLAEKYPSKESIYERIIHLKSQLALPKSTEHFMSDIHGEYESFLHILRLCSPARAIPSIPHISFRSKRMALCLVAVRF